MDGDDDEFDGTIGKNDEKSEIRPSIKICITRVIAVPQNSFIYNRNDKSNSNNDLNDMVCTNRCDWQNLDGDKYCGKCGL